VFGAINDSEDGGSLPKAKTSAISKICFTAGFRLSLAGFLFVIRILSGKVRCAYRCENGCQDLRSNFLRIRKGYTINI